MAKCDARGRLEAAARNSMVPVAPGVRIWRPKEGEEVPAMVVCRWTKVEGGYAPIPISGRYVRLTARLAEELGFRGAARGKRYDTIIRLWRAGFIEVAHISPGAYFIEMNSWYRHLAEASEEGFWEVGGGNRERYLEANGLTGRS